MKHLNSNWKIFLVLTFILFYIESNSQDLTPDMKTWYGINLNYKIAPRVKVKFGALLSQNTSPSAFSFAQGKLGISYKIKRRMYVEAGYVRLLLNDSESKRLLYDITPGMFDKLEFDRIYTNFSYKHDVVKRLSGKHKVEFQYFFPAVEKYTTRYIYSGRLAYNIRKSSIKPFIENQFYYYAGGIIENGFKRYRFKPGVSFKLIKDFPMGTSLYYISQNECNTEPLSDNDYNVLGISFTFTLN